MNRILAVIATLLDDFIIIVIIVFILPLLGINLPEWFIASIIALLLLISLLVYRALSQMKKPAMVGREIILGKIGEAVSDLDPQGLIMLENELWTAIAKDGKIEKGEKVKVIEIYGSKLIVEKFKSYNGEVS